VNQSSKPNPRVAMILVAERGFRPAVSAPPVLIVSTHTIHYTCCKCSTVLMHAEADQIHNVLIRCTQCGSYNATEE
jgi:DNA-directed RNA polymerase subunit RPC12/RpoP